MLVLSRKVDEKIVIGSDIVVTVLEIRGNRIRLGIEAPREVPVHRAELVPVHQKAISPAASEPASSAPLCPPATV